MAAIALDLPMLLAQLQGALHALEQTPAGALICAAGLLTLAVGAARRVMGAAAFVWVHFLRPGRNLRFYGRWAVVTGATDGIGKAYCEELARKGG